MDMMNETERINAWWRAANYLTAAQLYLSDNPLMRGGLKPTQIKKRIVGHWGTCPGQNFLYAQLCALIGRHDLNMLYLCGPGHGGAGLAANLWLEGSFGETDPNLTRDEEGMRRLVRQFSFPGGIQSHASPELPGSIHEGGELGYSLAHAFGAVMDHPGLIAACVIGDGEAETAPLAASWQSVRFLNPKTDGRVLPILHLNGYKIANPTLFARIPPEELRQYLTGCGWTPLFLTVGGGEREILEDHKAMTECLEESLCLLQNGSYPVIVFRSPKGWTGPQESEGSFKSHQLPLDVWSGNGMERLEQWLRSYHPEELFDENGTPKEEILSLAPKGEKRMGMNPNANGGTVLKRLKRPEWKQYALQNGEHGAATGSDMAILAPYVRDVIRLNPHNFRVFGPDELASNRLGAVFEVTGRRWELPIAPQDEALCEGGRVMDSMLSEHLCQGWLEGYILTGRHGFFHSYEAFIRIVDSMASQFAKWIKLSSEIPWRRKTASLNYVLASNVWQQDHNGFTHQDPGFLDHLANKKADVVRIYLPPDGNCLLSCFDHCIGSRGYINVIVASKHLRPQWLSPEEAAIHCAQGLGIWRWASNDEGCEPDIVLAACGETATLEVLAAIMLLRDAFPALKIRMVNVVDLMRLQPAEEHPHGLSDEDYDALFTKDKPILFAFHGYPKLIHELTYRRHNKNIHVRGYKEEGTITTPFDMRVQNDMDRFHLVISALRLIEGMGSRGGFLVQRMKDKLGEHRAYIREHGEDMPEILNWKWE